PGGNSVGLTFQTGSESDQTFDVNIANSTAEDLGVASNLDATSNTGDDAGQNVNAGDFSSTSSAVTALTTGGFKTLDSSGTNLAGDLEGGTFEINAQKSGSNLTLSATGTTATFTGTGASTFDGTNDTLTLSSDGSNKIALDASNLSITTGQIGSSETKSFSVEVKDSDDIGRRLQGGSSDEARNIIDDVDSAIDGLTSQLSDLGASQNRLSFKESNLETSQTNLNAAQSRIEDADFAKEQTQVAKLQVQQQSGTAQLAQANAAGQSVLSLLQ
ncbi:flagellin, partial [Salinibacter altiplanensis]|uniref:flagellin n=1 Tax=Salinibacter altiplanensis TaxID=1803181 RepID=UPI0021D3670B